MTTITVTYGLLSEEDLVNFFKESFELDYNPQQFIKPTSDFVLSVYLTLIDNFNLNLDLNHLPYMNKVVKLAQTVEELLNRCNILDFKIGDILQPKRRRTQTFVSQLVGIFLETVEFNNILLNNQLADDLELNDAIEREKTRNENLRNEITKKKRDCSKLKPEMDQLNARNDELREQMRTSHALSQELNLQGAVIKREKTQITSVLSNKEYERLNLISEIDRLEEDFRLVTGDVLQQAENNKRTLDGLRNECRQIEEKSRELMMFKNLKREHVNDLRAEQDEINRTRLILKENLVEKDNFKEKNKACIGEIECLKQKSIELEEEYLRKIEEKKAVLQTVESNMEPVLELERLLRRDLKKKSELKQRDEEVVQAKEATERKQQEIDYYLRLKEQVSQQYNALNEDLIAKLKQLNSD